LSHNNILQKFAGFSPAFPVHHSNKDRNFSIGLIPNSRYQKIQVILEVAGETLSGCAGLFLPALNSKQKIPVQNGHGTAIITTIPKVCFRLIKPIVSRPFMSCKNFTIQSFEIYKR
jgi:hypothetical protein